MDEDCADQWLYDFDALAEQGLEDEPTAWAALQRVDELLARLRGR